MWDLPQSVVSAGTHQTLLEVVAQQFRDPPRFIDRVRAIYATSPPETYDLLELADGRVFERFSRPQFVDARNVGRVWSFRDITPQRRADELLRNESERFRITLSSIGDAVISTDARGRHHLSQPGRRVADWLDARGSRWPTACPTCSTSSTPRPARPSRIRRCAPCAKGESSGLPITRCSSRGTASSGRSTTARHPSLTQQEPSSESCSSSVTSPTVCRRARCTARLAAIVESSHDVIISKITRRHDPVVESRSRAPVRLHRRGSDRPAHRPHHPAGS